MLGFILFILSGLNLVNKQQRFGLKIKSPISIYFCLAYFSTFGLANAKFSE